MNNQYDALITLLAKHPSSYHGGDFAHAVDPYGFGRLLAGTFQEVIADLELQRAKLITALVAKEALMEHIDADRERYREMLGI
jgi:hypothetical protein